MGPHFVSTITPICKPWSERPFRTGPTLPNPILKGDDLVTMTTNHWNVPSWDPHPTQTTDDQLRKAGGFQMYNQETGDPIGNPMEYIRDGLQFGKLSGGQQHLIYVLPLGVGAVSFAKTPHPIFPSSSWRHFEDPKNTTAQNQRFFWMLLPPQDQSCLLIPFLWIFFRWCGRVGYFFFGAKQVRSVTSIMATLD